MEGAPIMSYSFNYICSFKHLNIAPKSKYSKKMEVSIMLR